jgi:hypothetical protein
MHVSVLLASRDGDAPFPEGEAQTLQDLDHRFAGLGERKGTERAGGSTVSLPPTERKSMNGIDL